MSSVAERLAAGKQLIRLRPREGGPEQAARPRRPGAGQNLLPDDELLLTVGVWKFNQGRGPLSILQASMP